MSWYSIATGLIAVCGANPWLDSTILIVKWNASTTACITSASAHESLAYSKVYIPAPATKK